VTTIEYENRETIASICSDKLLILLVKTITQVASPTPSIVQRDIHTYTLTLSIILDVIEALQTSAQKEWDKQKTDLQNKPVITSVELNERANVAKHLMKA
jgi:hypothetical protein